MDDRIEDLLKDLRSELGKNSVEIRENVSRYLAGCEEHFRNDEIDRQKKDEAAQRCRRLIRERVTAEEVSSNERVAAHLRFVLSIIDGPASALPQP